MDTGRPRAKRVKTILKWAAPIILVLFIGISPYIYSHVREREYAQSVWPGQDMENWKYGPYLTYEPYSGKLFKLNPADIAGFNWVSVKGEDEGEDDTFIQSVNRRDVTDREAVEEWVELLNSFRYTSWRAENRRAARPDGNGISRMYIVIYHTSTEAGEEKMFWDEIILKKDCLHIGGCWYYGDEEFFERVKALAYGNRGK